MVEKKYIDASKLNLYDDLFMKGKNDSGVWVRYRDVENLIKNAPTANVQEVRHGKWIAQKRGKFKDYLSVCSLCGHQILNDFIKESKYCPACGARLDGGGNNEP